MSKVTRKNHFPGINNHSYLVVQNEDSEIIQHFELTKGDEALEVAESLVEDDISPVGTLLEITETYCLECGEVCIRTERELVVFELSPEEAKAKHHAALKELMGEDAFIEFARLNPSLGYNE